MSLNAAWTTVLVAFLLAMVPIVPTIVLLIRTYLEVQTNKLRIADRPTHDEVATAIESRAQELLANGNDKH